MSLVYGQCQSGVSCPPTCPPSTPIYGGLNYGSTECRNSVGGVCAYGTNYEYAYSGAVDNIGVDCPSSSAPVRYYTIGGEADICSSSHSMRMYEPVYESHQQYVLQLSYRTGD